MAVFEFTDESYIDAVWYVAWEGTDWLGMIYRDGALAPWRATYRFRYYAPGEDDKAWESGDERSVFEVTGTDDSDETRGKLEAAFEHITGELAAATRGTRWTLRIRGDSTRLVKRLKRVSWGHVRTGV